MTFPIHYPDEWKYRAADADTADRVHRDICHQITWRGRFVGWPDDPLRQRVADILAAAVAHEKFIDTVGIHPDDPLPLMIWGPFDDLTPLVFSMAFEEAFEKRVTIDWRALWESDARVAELIECCVGQCEAWDMR